MSTIIGGSDVLSYYDDLYGDASSQSTSKLQSSLTGTDYSQATDDELMDVCKEFESYLVEQVIKQMEKMVPKSEEDSTMGKYMDYFGDTLTQELAGNITDSNGGNGLGIAQTLYEQMKRNYGL